MKFASSSVVFPANSMITVTGDFQSASTLLLPDRVEDDDFKDDFAKLLLLCSKREGVFILLSPLTPDLIPPIIIIGLNIDKKSARLNFIAPASTVMAGELPLPLYLRLTVICLSAVTFAPIIST